MNSEMGSIGIYWNLLQSIGIYCNLLNPHVYVYIYIDMSIYGAAGLLSLLGP